MFLPNAFRDTPIEMHEGIYVKREDLCCTLPSAPPTAKLRGLVALVENKPRPIGIADTGVSMASWGVASILGKDSIVYYPRNKYSDMISKAAELGSILVEMQPGQFSLLFHRSKKEIESRGGYMLPQGLASKEAVLATADTVRRENLEKFGCIVVSCGSGTITAGILIGSSCPVYAVSCGMDTKLQRGRIERMIALADPVSLHRLDMLEIIDSSYDYWQVETRPTPFPCDEHYDRKAWYWLLANLRKVEEIVLFWNIGGMTGEELTPLKKC